MISMKHIYSIAIAAVAIIVVIFVFNSIQQSQQAAIQQQAAHTAQCAQQLAQINQDKSSILQGIFNQQQVNQLIDQYNGQCTSTPTNFAGGGQ
jgi:hypothetical protein